MQDGSFINGEPFNIPGLFSLSDGCSGAEINYQFSYRPLYYDQFRAVLFILHLHSQYCIHWQSIVFLVPGFKGCCRATSNSFAAGPRSTFISSLSFLCLLFYLSLSCSLSLARSLSLSSRFRFLPLIFPSGSHISLRVCRFRLSTYVQCFQWLSGARIGVCSLALLAVATFLFKLTNLPTQVILLLGSIC